MLVWWCLGLIAAGVAVGSVVHRDWSGALSAGGVVAGCWTIAKVEERVWAMAWRAATHRYDHLIAERLPAAERIELLAQMASLRPTVREYYDCMGAMTRDLARMERPTQMDLHDLYERHHIRGESDDD